MRCSTKLISVVMGIVFAWALLVDCQSRCSAQSNDATSATSNTSTEIPLAAEFRARDVDGDGMLTLEEYMNGGGPEKTVLRRNFQVFDANADGRMSLAEFQTVPGVQPEDQRGVIPDPIVLLSQRAMAELAEHWPTWDQNGDDSLTEPEFVKADIGQRVPGLGSIPFAEWDLNHDGSLDRTEAARVMDIAYGVCIPTGERLRSDTGRVVDWIMFQSLKKNDQGFVARDDYLRVLDKANPDPEGWYRSIDKNGDGQFDYAEFAGGTHRTDPVGMFLHLDADLDGRLSFAELERLPDGWRQMAKQGFPGFDDDQDGLLSLREYQLMPQCNLLAHWRSAQDVNQDGVLSRDEFRFVPGLPLAALTAEYFRRLDRNQDKVLSLDEWTFSTTHPGAKFVSLDKDSNGKLSEAEFIAEGSFPAKRMSRDWMVLDTDQDQGLSLSEFMALPYWISAELRTAPPDPIVLLAEKTKAELKRSWKEWDTDSDGTLNSEEFEKAPLTKQIASGFPFSGFYDTRFVHWDLDGDKNLTEAEAGNVVEIAWGIRTLDGGLLRSKSGHVVDWRLFRDLKRDAAGFVTRDAYFEKLGSLPDRDAWFASNDKNNDGKFDFAEFAMGNHRTDPVANFLDLDTDFNGKLDPREIEKLPGDRFPVGDFLFPGFDDDRDGSLSMSEFRLTPVINLLASWNSALDANQDGMLSLTEFRFDAGIALSELCAEYFQKLDVDHDNALSLDEFRFVTAAPAETEIHVQYPDGRLTVIAIPDYPLINSPEISPDNKWVAVDGWKHGQNNVSAHVLLASLESDDVQDWGTACIPHWSPDGRQLAYSKYSSGVFVRNFGAKADEEESIDPQGWAIHFSPDGQSVAYVQNGNLVIYDLKTHKKRFVFPQDPCPYSYIEHNFTWSPDSQRICFKGHRPDGKTIEVGIVTVVGDDPRLRIRCDGKQVQSDFAWVAGGKRLMFPMLQADGGRTQIYEMDPDGDQPATRYPQQPLKRNNGGLCWSRDGKILVFMSTR